MRMNTSITVAVLVGMTLASCSAPNPYQTNSNQNTTAGAATGAVLGGIIGATTGKKNLQSAALGAAAGAVVGGVAGNIVDRQSADLRSQLANSGITVTNMGSYLVLNTPSDLLFATGSATLSSKLQRDLQTVANSLSQYPASAIQVVGHTDNTGTAAFNQDLSQRRASAVASALINGGVAAGRFKIEGRGEDQPIASNLTEEGRSQNRRVEIIIRPSN